MSDLRLILVGVIIFVVCLILASILVSVARRVANQRRYEKLDGLRDQFMRDISNVIESGASDSIGDYVRASKIRTGSLEWAALEEVLFILSEEEAQKLHARQLFEAFGYTQFHHSQLRSHGSSIKLCTGADKLGRIGDASAVGPLSDLLNHHKPEVVTVAFRALCRIGTDEALQYILSFLPPLINDRRISLKAVQTSLALLGHWAAAPLVQHAGKTDDPEVLAVILEALTAFPARRETFDFALGMLSHPDPEVRGKALRVLAHGGEEARTCEAGIFLPLMNDPVWFVRLHAAKAIGKVKCNNFIEMLKKLSLDERWQVRDAATLSLAETGEGAIDAFLELLESPDRFAKESISEGIQRTGFVLKLIGYLGGDDLEKRAKAERILRGMHRAGFSTPLREAVEAGTSGPKITAELNKILLSGGAS